MGALTGMAHSASYLPEAGGMGWWGQRLQIQLFPAVPIMHHPIAGRRQGGQCCPFMGGPRSLAAHRKVMSRCLREKVKRTRSRMLVSGPPLLPTGSILRRGGADSSQ